MAEEEEEGVAEFPEGVIDVLAAALRPLLLPVRLLETVRLVESIRQDLHGSETRPLDRRAPHHRPGQLDAFVLTVMTSLATAHPDSFVLPPGTAFWGYANVERKERPAGDTAYLLASVSKLFTATAVMQLEERGQLDLDTDVNEVLPSDFPAIRNPRFRSVPITIRQLLTHTSSIRDDWDRIDDSYQWSSGRDPEVSMGGY